MENEEKKISINLDPILYTITNINIGFNEENFDFMIFSGNQARQFHATPKHAKRIVLLLQQKITEYEKQFGELKTQLPEKTGTSKKEEKLGF